MVHTQRYDRTLNYKIQTEFYITKSNLSTNFITPGLVRGCQLNCEYCSIKELYPSRELHMTPNIDFVIEKLEKHILEQPWPKTPDHTHPLYYTYDIGYFNDIGIDFEYNKRDYIKLFDFFKNHPRAMACFSTKIVNYNLMPYQADRKIRIVFSLCPDSERAILEKDSYCLLDKVAAVDSFVLSDWNCDLLLSPIIINGGYLTKWGIVMENIERYVKYKDKVGLQLKFLECPISIVKKQENSRIRELLINPSIQITESGSLIYHKNTKKKTYQYLKPIIQKYLSEMFVRFIH
jgi:spore photoproduct lyase